MGLRRTIGLAAALACALALGGLAAPAPDAPLKGDWRLVGGASDNPGMQAALADMASLRRQGDIVSGRVGYVHNTVQHAGPGQDYVIRITEAEINCVSRTRRAPGLTAWNAAGQKVVTLGPSGDAFEPVDADATGPAVVDAFCGHLQSLAAYSDLRQAQVALIFMFGADGGPPHPFSPGPDAHALMAAPAPPEHPEWRAVDEQADRTVVVETSSLWLEDGVVTLWTGIIARDPQPDAKRPYVFAVMQVSVDCANTGGNNLKGLRMMLFDAAGRLVEDRGHGGDRGILGRTNGVTAFTGACNPGLVTTRPAFADPIAYRAARWPN